MTFRQRGRRRVAGLSLAALLCLAAAAHAAWIPVKAELAQWLIERSWNEALAGREAPPPWPWADTRALAVLEAPARDVRLVVLEGASGRNLAFGPVFANGTESGRDMVISGHRDTHFRFLEALGTGDRFTIRRASGFREFEVVDAAVVDSRQTGMRVEPGLDRVRLVTCWPFDSPTAGGPMRYVITALPLERLRDRPPRSGG